jgi:hypothetical protein
MKKFLTLIAFTCALVPTIQGMEAYLYEKAQKKAAKVHKRYDKLCDKLNALIQSADTQAFKVAFDRETFPIENIRRLEQSVFEAKRAIAKKIDSTKSWSKLAQGTLETGVGILGTALACVSIKNIITGTPLSEETLDKAELAFFFLSLLGEYRSVFLGGALLSSNRFSRETRTKIVLGLSTFIGSALAYSGFTYGFKSLHDGWNYKQILQDKLANLDAIAAHIARAKAQAAYAM